VRSPVIHFGTPQEVVYTNHRKETAMRRIIPQFLWFGTSDHHPGAQWFLEAFDLDRHATRTFALASIKTG
jgi:predicted DNA-binding transcriptional regulator YafY